MNKFSSFLKWLRSKFFYLTIGIFIIIYIWWFLLNPIVFAPGESATDNFIAGLVLLLIYFLIIGIWRLSRDHPFVKYIFLSLAIFFLAVNTLFVINYFPHIETSAEYSGVTYYITSNNPFLDCCGFYQFTKWQGFFHYESFFYSYSGGPYRFFYDKQTKEVSILNGEYLDYTDSNPPRSYDGAAQAGDHKYYILSVCSTWKKYDSNGIITILTNTPSPADIAKPNYSCNTWKFTFYQCELDNTSCEILPFEYVGYDPYGIDVLFDKKTKEISLYFGLPKELIFTYGTRSQCYADGCTIIDK